MEHRDVQNMHVRGPHFTDSEVGDGLLTEFLRRLPLKSVFKFKCVSKRWFSLISSPSMHRLYLPRTDMPTYALLCQHTNPMGPAVDDVSIRIEGHPEFESSVNFKLGFSPKEPEELRIMSADKGLLLSCELNSTRQALYVSNPLTGQWTGLPEPPRFAIFENPTADGPGSMNAGGSGSIHQPPLAIGFIVGPGSAYKVIRIRDFGPDSLQLASFDSGEGNWRSSVVLLSHPLIEKPHGRLVSGVFYRGALHWAFDGKIVAYDPAMHESEGDDYKCRVFDCAPSSGVYGDGRLGLSGGEIRYAELTSAHNQISPRFLYVWLLKDYDSAEWCLEHKILQPEIPIRYDHLQVVSVWDFNPVDGDMLYFYVRSEASCDLAYCKSLVAYSISRRTMKLLCTHGHVQLPPTPARLSIHRDNVFVYRLYDGPPHLWLSPTISAVPFVLPPWPHEVKKQIENNNYWI